MYKRKNHSKYSLKVHLVFVVKYRKNIVNKELSDFIKSQIRNLSKDSNFNVEYGRTMTVFLKRHFWRERTFWSNGYFACSIGEGPSYEVMQKYIKNQG